VDTGFSEKIMLRQKKLERDDDSKKSHPALAGVTASSAAMGCAATERLNAAALSVSNCLCDSAGLLADTARREHLDLRRVA
jgi:hypothetical protein